MAAANSINESTTGICGFTGTGFTATPVTQNAVLIGGSTSSTLSSSLGTNGTILAGVTGSDAAFTATPAVTSININSGTTLNTFVQGTWTPGISFGGGTTGITYTTQSGEYTRIGNVVFYSFFVLLSSKGSSTGVSAVTGLPVTVGGGFAGATPLQSDTITLDAADSYLTLRITSGGTIGGVFEEGSGLVAPVNITDTSYTNTSSLRGSGLYFTS